MYEVSGGMEDTVLSGSSLSVNLCGFFFFFQLLNCVVRCLVQWKCLNNVKPLLIHQVKLVPQFSCPVL